MNIREGIIQALKNNTDLYALVAERIYSAYAPSNTPGSKTWIVITKISGGEEAAHDGDAQLTHPIFQFTVEGTNKTEVDEVCRLLIDGFNAHEYLYTENAEQYELTLFHVDDRDHPWDSTERTSSASVDMEVWAYKQPQSAQ
jgi:hypothetical protein